MMDIIGVDVGGTKIRAGIVSGKKISKIATIKTHADGSQKQINSQIMAVIDQLINSKVKAIGVGLPAIVDVKRGIVLEAVNIKSWKNVHLKRILEKKYSVPVFVNNDANCFVLGEKNFGHGRKYQNIVGITLGTGFGGGIIINKILYSGQNGAAGEFGQIPYKNHTFEYYCSGQYYKNEFQMHGEDITIGAKLGQKKALSILNLFGKHLGQAIATVVNSFDPELIVFGGSISRDYAFFEKSMKKSLKKSVYHHVYSKLKIKQSTIKNVAVLGAASLYFNYNVD
jgi:glucokinase